jgi:hypothetical protein
MPIALYFELDGISQDQYDDSLKAIGRDALDSPKPEGMIAHVAGPTAGGWRVLDIWESQAAADAFYGTEAFQSMASDMAADAQPEPWPLRRLEVEKTIRHEGSL